MYRSFESACPSVHAETSQLRILYSFGSADDVERVFDGLPASGQRYVRLVQWALWTPYTPYGPNIDPLWTPYHLWTPYGPPMDPL